MKKRKWFQLRRYVGLYEEYPFGYVPTWYDACKQRDVCYPIGIHWIARYMHNVWWWLLQVPFNKWERELIEAFNSGYRVRCEQLQKEYLQSRQAYQEAYGSGFEAGKQEFIQVLNEAFREDAESNILCKCAILQVEVEAAHEGETNVDS